MYDKTGVGANPISTIDPDSLLNPLRKDDFSKLDVALISEAI